MTARIWGGEERKTEKAGKNERPVSLRETKEKPELEIWKKTRGNRRGRVREKKRGFTG